MKNNNEEQINSLLQYYYSFILKVTPKKDDHEKSFNTLSYLFDCGYDYLKILEMVKKFRTPAITPDVLPDSLWEGSLVKRGAFYLHRELAIIAPAPKFDLRTMEFKEEKFYYEIKARYTEDDVVEYFHSQLNPLNKITADKKADKKAVIFLVNKYKAVDYVEPLDIILCCIDRYMEDHPDCYRLIEVSNYAFDVIMELQRDMQQLMSEDRRKITWR